MSREEFLSIENSYYADFEMFLTSTMRHPKNASKNPVHTIC